MPHCNGADTAKAARVSHTKWLSTNEEGKADDGGPARWCAPRSVTTSFAQSESCGPTGKRSAGKLACSVWSGGKAARPYLSLLKVVLHQQSDLVGALAATDAQTVGPQTTPLIPGTEAQNNGSICLAYASLATGIDEHE